MLFPISLPTVKKCADCIFFFFFFFFFFFAHEEKKNPRLTPNNPGFYIHSLHNLSVPIFGYYRSSSFVFFISNMAAPLQAKPSTLVQFISKRAAISWPKIKQKLFNTAPLYHWYSKTVKCSVREVKLFYESIKKIRSTDRNLTWK